MAIDTSSLGFFANPFEPDAVLSDVTSWTQDAEALHTHEASIGTFIQDVRHESAQPPEQFYQVLTTLDNNLAHAADGVPVDPTSADINASLMRELMFFHHVVAGICVDRDPCVYDPRSFEASGTATFRQQIAPIPSRRRSRCSASASWPARRADCDSPECDCAMRQPEILADQADRPRP